MAYIWMCHATRVQESRYTCEWVTWMSNGTHGMSHATRVKESCHTCEWVMSHILRWSRALTLVCRRLVRRFCNRWERIEAFQMCEWVMSHVVMRQMWMRWLCDVRDIMHTFHLRLFTIHYCNTLHTWHTHTMTSGIHSRYDYCNTLLQHATATHYCNTLHIQHTHMMPTVLWPIR